MESSSRRQPDRADSRALLLRRIRNVLLVFVLIIILIAGSIVGGVTYAERHPLPQTDGTLALSGLQGKVQVYRDASGIPHIYATTVHDLFFAQGYVQAQDRWWQMEFNRHTAQGRISELVGKDDTALQSDIFIRTAGWNRAAQADLGKLEPESAAALDGFSSGVNAYLGGKSGPDLAVEYSLLGLNGVNINIEPWQPLDSVSWSIVMSWSLGENLDIELELAQLYQKFGSKDSYLIDQNYIPPYPYDQHQSIILPDELPIKADTTTVRAVPFVAPGTDLSNVQTALAGSLPHDFGSILGMNTGAVSNNWVISGKKTESGKPLLANDPHLGVSMPSIWYEMGLHCVAITPECPYDVVGYTFPGVPGVIIGHNQRIAWGVTNAGPDTQDLYIIKVDPQKDTSYEVDGKTEDMEVVTEKIRFGDSTPAQNIRVRITRFGPIITDSAAYKQKSSQPLALHWVAISEVYDPLIAILQVDRATNWTEFRQGLRKFVSPSQNYIYADVDGNIGYQLPGLIPIRAKDHGGLTPVDGSTTKYQWKDYIPYDYLPSLYNPPRGYIETANQAIVPPQYYQQLAEALGDKFGRDSNYAIAAVWDYGYRAQQVANLIASFDKHSVATMKTMQGDNFNGSAADLLPAALRLKYMPSDVPQEVIEWMAQWDYLDEASSGQAAMYEVFWARLARKLWNDELGYIPDGPSIYWQTKLLLNQPDNPWWDDKSTPNKVETRDDILKSAFSDAYHGLVAQYGSDYKKWTWGDLHTVTFVSNPVGQAKIAPIRDFVNAGPYGVSGSGPTINRTAWKSADPYKTTSISSMRMIVDLSNLNNSLWIQSTGQSGHPASPHYRDMIDHWRSIQYDPMLSTLDRIKASAVSTLILEPK
jgi:penicillin amidase